MPIFLFFLCFFYDSQKKVMRYLPLASSICGCSFFDFWCVRVRVSCHFCFSSSFALRYIQMISFCLFDFLPLVSVNFNRQLLFLLWNEACTPCCATPHHITLTCRFFVVNINIIVVVVVIFIWMSKCKAVTGKPMLIQPIQVHNFSFYMWIVFNKMSKMNHTNRRSRKNGQNKKGKKYTAHTHTHKRVKSQHTIMHAYRRLE